MSTVYNRFAPSPWSMSYAFQSQPMTPIIDYTNSSDATTIYKYIKVGGYYWLYTCRSSRPKRKATTKLVIKFPRQIRNIRAMFNINLLVLRLYLLEVLCVLEPKVYTIYNKHLPQSISKAIVTWWEGRLAKYSKAELSDINISSNSYCYVY